MVVGFDEILFARMSETVFAFHGLSRELGSYPSLGLAYISVVSSPQCRHPRKDSFQNDARVGISLSSSFFPMLERFYNMTSITPSFTSPFSLFRAFLFTLSFYASTWGLSPRRRSLVQRSQQSFDRSRRLPTPVYSIGTTWFLTLLLYSIDECPHSRRSRWLRHTLATLGIKADTMLWPL